MLPMCADLGVGCIPYSPLGKGRLARPWGQQTQRGNVDQVAKSFDLDIDQPVIDAVQAVAEARGSPWLRSRWPGCSAGRSSPPRSSAPPNLTTSPTPSTLSTSPSPTTRSSSSKRRTRPNPRTGGESAGPFRRSRAPLPHPYVVDLQGLGGRDRRAGDREACDHVVGRVGDTLGLCPDRHTVVVETNPPGDQSTPKVCQPPVPGMSPRQASGYPPLVRGSASVPAW